jgi:predicted metallopeptidase
MAVNYLPFPELKNVIEIIIEKFNLNYIKPDRIYCQFFSQKRSSTLGRIGPIPKRFSNALSTYEYFLEIHKESWDVADEAKRLYVVYHELLHIPEEGFVNSSKDYCKTVKHDIQDFACLLKNYGVEQEKINLLKQKIS